MKKYLLFKKVKNTVLWTYVINDLNGEEITGTFYENNYKKQIKKNSELKKKLDEKEINFMLNGKDIIIHLIVGLIKQV